ncbi:hypothetical protein OKW98_20585 [Pseudomonas sp. KU26590]|uniref:hypothetical protein n=1 Tax=Pseudomonas sp. KU26590 TaxID=2991051 RepID=UPI00223E3BC6|nr:hypothetical protein [Pseudomonas sp. KU26590]UZJ58949.1 hypothetical protein OKW98_20585 [Pseudomonas sp. KU26590]
MKIDTRMGSANYNEKQISSFLLCVNCEDLFSKNGEKAMGNLWATHTEFPLLDMLEQQAHIVTGKKISIYDSSKIDKKIRDALFYFAVSIFWRAQVWDWGRQTDTYKKALGVKYELAFRRFLLGVAGLADVRLMVILNNSATLNGIISIPYAGKTKGCYVHNFDLLGIKFSLIVGGHPPAVLKTAFNQFNSEVIFLSSDFEYSPDFLQIAKTVQTTVAPRGRLALTEPDFGIGVTPRNGP